VSQIKNNIQYCTESQSETEDEDELLSRRGGKYRQRNVTSASPSLTNNRGTYLMHMRKPESESYPPAERRNREVNEKRFHYRLEVNSRACYP